MELLTGNMNLISGTSSGLGKYLFEKITAYKYIRTGFMPHQSYSKIIHCGWDTSTPTDLWGYITDALNHAEQLLRFPHKQFIFISSIDVYPKTHRCNEETNIDPRNIVGIYAQMKFAVEQMVLKYATNPLIIRPAILLGPYTRGSISYIGRNQYANLPVSLNTNYSFTLYDDILKVINADLTGIYNVLGNDRMSLRGIVATSMSDPNKWKFGDYEYDCGYISNEKIVKLIPEIDQSAYEKYEIWKKEFANL